MKEHHLENRKGYLVPFDTPGGPAMAFRGKIRINGETYSLRAWKTPSNDGGSFLSLKATKLEDVTAEQRAERNENNTPENGQTKEESASCRQSPQSKPQTTTEKNSPLKSLNSMLKWRR